MLLKYKNLGTTIAIDLHNDYEIIAMANYNHEKNLYDVKFYIHDITTGLLDEFEEFELKSTPKTLRYEITKNVTERFYNGDFENCIKNYKYQMNCFDKGNSLLEEERLFR